MTLTPLDLRAVREAFDRAAPDYDRYAVLQQEVAQRLLERLAYFQLQPTAVLDLGCGTGGAIETLSGLNPDALVVGLDWSPAMLGQAAQKINGRERPALLCADMLSLPLASRSMELVVSNLAIQWSPRPQELFSELRRVLKPGGLFLFTTFGPGTLTELRQAWSEADEGQHVNEFHDILEVGDQLVAAGFQEPVLDVERMTLAYRDVLSLMRELKAIGAHNAASDRASGLTGRGKLRRVLAAYEEFRSEGSYPASYEVVYGATFAPAAGQPVRSAGGEVAEFPVESLVRGRPAR